MFRPPIGHIDPQAHIGPVHGPDRETFTARTTRELRELIKAHTYVYGGPCGGCSNEECHWIDDDPAHDESFEDHVVSVLVKHYGLRWSRAIVSL